MAPPPSKVSDSNVGTKKRKSNRRSRNLSSSKRRRLGTTDSSDKTSKKANIKLDDDSEAVRQRRARRDKEPASDVFAVTTIRAQAQKLKQLPLELRRMIYVEHFDPKRLNSRIEVKSAPVESRNPLVFTIGGQSLNCACYLDPKYVGDQIAAETLGALYHDTCFEVGLRNLYTLVQGCGFLAKADPMAAMRRLMINMGGCGHYLGYGQDNVKLNAADWIDAKDDGLTRDSNDQLNPVGAIRIPHEASPDYLSWRLDRIVRQNEHAGLRSLCRMPKLKTLEFRLFRISREHADQDARALIPLVRRLKGLGVAVKVLIGYKGATYDPETDAFELEYEEILPRWMRRQLRDSVDVSDMFNVPSTEDLEWARQTLRSDLEPFSIEWLSETPFLGHGRMKVNPPDLRCVRVKIDQLYDELEERVASGRYSEDDPITVGLNKAQAHGLLHYGNLLAAEAHFRALMEAKAEGH